MKVSLAKAYKPTSLPRTLIYNPPNTEIFRMIRTKNPKQVGYMSAYPAKKNGKDYLLIGLLMIFDKRKRYGTEFINFAKNYSKRNNFGGRIILQADATVADPHNAPHVFYRKQGFTSDDKKAIKNIDKHIRKNKELDPHKTPALIMYYDPDLREEKLTFFEKIKIYFSNLL